MARTFTTAELRNLALQEIGVLPEGETPSAASAELAEIALEVVHAQLDGLELLNWPPCAVPAAVALPVVRLAARELVEPFGLSSERAARLIGGAERAMVEIRQQTAVGHSGTVKAVYY